jgi:hypothetical protein
MTDIKIDCPHCHQSFKLNETLAAPLVEETRRKFEKEFEGKEGELEARLKVFEEQQKQTAKAKKQLDKERADIVRLKEEMAEQVAEQVAEQRDTIAKEEAKKAKQKYDEKLAEQSVERQELEASLKEKDKKLAEARKAEVEFLKMKRELDDKLKAADVEVEKRLAEAIAPEREKAKKEAEDAVHLVLAAKDKLLDDAKSQIDEMKRKMAQGSQQLQGEIQELDLEKRLRDTFPRDTIEPVPKGQFGGDAIHRVLSPQGQVSGTILWESKNTKSWGGGWPDKLKHDQRAAKADIAVIVTRAMPQGIETFGECDGVWVTTPSLAMAVAAALRLTLTEAALARRASEGQQDKMAILYHYLTGPHFRQRVEAIKDAFTTMQDDLNSEIRAINKQWAKRQQQIERVMVSTVGMYGDLQAIAGRTLQEIEGLEMKALGTSQSIAKGAS